MSSKVIRGLRSPKSAYHHLAKKPFALVDRYWNYGTNIFDRDWDLLVVLDACRYDLFATFVTQHSVYDHFDSVERTYSIASQTVDWLDRTFEGADRSLLAETLYVSDHDHIAMADSDLLYGGAPIPLTEQNSTGGVLRPESVTAEALRQFETSGAEKYIVHYIQPHAPFLHCAGKYDSTAYEGGSTLNVWNGIRDGKYDREEVWRDYGQNLLLVLDHVETLIENFEGTVAVTSDHGNAMGEFGLYGHPGREAAPSIRGVPWAIASGTGGETTRSTQRES